MKVTVPKKTVCLQLMLFLGGLELQINVAFIKRHAWFGLACWLVAVAIIGCFIFMELWKNEDLVIKF